VLLLKSFDAVSILPEKCPRPCEAENGPGKVEFNDGPDPKTTNGRRLLHDSYVSKSVCYVYQITTGVDACDEEN
jgi:hypothetical protein